jgi:predicted negative regulator of RcsB-dependent stress response
MEMPLKGNIKDVSLVKILVQLGRNRKTGTLTIATSSASKNVYLKAGDVIFASSTYEDDRLGEMLLKAGKITVEQYDKSVEVLKATGKRQGAILAELGYLTPKEIFWGLKYQVQEIIQSMFVLEEAGYEFREGNFPAQEVITLKMSMGNLIYAGINRITNWTRIRSEMPDTDSVLKLSEDPLSLFQDIELSSQDKKILSLIDGKKTIKEIIGSAWLGSFEALKILYVLWSIGMIEKTATAGINGRESATAKGKLSEEALGEIFRTLSEAEETQTHKVTSLYNRLGSLSFCELLEVDRTADTETITKNYYRLTKEYHPDRHLALADLDTKMKLTTICDALTRAYNTLQDDKLRMHYCDAPTAREKAETAGQAAKAEEQFKKASAEFRKGNFSAAVGHFSRAAQLSPDNASYLSYLALAYTKVPGMMKEAEGALQKAIKLEPFNAGLHANLGLICLKAGLKKKALSSFQKALKIDPQHEKARKGLEKAKT